MEVSSTRIPLFEAPCIRVSGLHDLQDMTQTKDIIARSANRQRNSWAFRDLRGTGFKPQKVGPIGHQESRVDPHVVGLWFRRDWFGSGSR